MNKEQRADLAMKIFNNANEISERYSNFKIDFFLNPIHKEKGRRVIEGRLFDEQGNDLSDDVERVFIRQDFKPTDYGYFADEAKLCDWILYIYKAALSVARTNNFENNK